MYARTLPIHRSSPSLATLIIELNEQQLMQSIRTIQSYNEGRVYILGDNNQLLASSEQQSESADLHILLNQDFTDTVETMAAPSELGHGHRARIDEFGYLEDVIEQALTHNTNMTKTIEKQKKTLFSNLLVRLLKGGIEQSYPLHEVLPEYGIHLYSEKFAVMLFYLEDYSGFFR